MAELASTTHVPVAGFQDPGQPAASLAPAAPLSWAARPFLGHVTRSALN
jgi:hypothetical protein